MSLFKLYKDTVAERDRLDELFRNDRENKCLEMECWKANGRIDGIIECYADLTGFDFHDARDQLILRWRKAK